LKFWKPIFKKILGKRFSSDVKWTLRWKGEEYGQDREWFTIGKKVASYKKRANAGGDCLARLSDLPGARGSAGP
jgi:hypothetical protein